jgi:hypothetical protein
MTLKEFEKLNWEHDCSKTKLPKDYVPITKFTDKTANGLTKAIVTFINLAGGQAERISSMGRVIDGRKVVTNVLGQTGLIGSQTYIKGTSTNGTADISSIIKGKSVKIEVKIGRDKMSPAQIEYKANVERAGGVYIIAKDWQGFIEEYNKL